LQVNRQTQIAVYYFPNYHVDRRNEAWHGAGWSEWELVKRATPRYEGHFQPKTPAWGYEDEADPAVMAKKIDAAADHGIDSFIFDWYWYEDGPYLQRALEEGYLQAPNNSRLKFAVMWANHHWMDIHPAARHQPSPMLAKGTVSEQAFERMTDHLIRTYFAHPSYWRVNGGLYVSVYELSLLVESFGGVADTRRALDRFRDKVRAAGLGELHLNAVVWGQAILPGEKKVENVNELLAQLRFDSITSYVWIHHQELANFPETSYAAYRSANEADYAVFTDKYELPYFPNVTMGWDSSPRTIQSDRFDSLGYPFTPVLAGNTPEQFGLALEDVKRFLDRGRTQPRILTINAWNEWTEGSYLEPDTINGTGYLEAIKRVFGAQAK